MPSFLSKLVKTSGHTRDGSDSSASRHSRRRTQSEYSASKSDLSAQLKSTSKVNVSRVPSIRADSVSDSDSIGPNVTVVPPSPLNAAQEHLPGSDTPPQTARPKIDGLNMEPNGTTNRTTSPAPTPVNSPVTPLVGNSSGLSSSRHSSRSPSPRSSNTNLKEKGQKKLDITPVSPASSVTLDTPTPRMRHQGSNKSLNASVPAIVTTTPNSAHGRAATTPDFRRTEDEAQNSVLSMTPISESPTSIRSPQFPSFSDSTVPQLNGRSATMLTAPLRDADSVSLASTSPAKEKKSRPWRRSTSSKPSGLASAIAASGLAMANPVASQLSPPASLSSSSTRRPNLATSPTRTPSGGIPKKKKSREVSPRSSKSRRSNGGSATKRRPSTAHSDANSEYLNDEATPGVADYYSGLEDDSSEDTDDDSSDQDGLLDLDLEEHAVTGFAVASNKRNSDFHELFPSVPETDYLIEDYGCALQREILIQGRLYISENYICFHANIFGWITDLCIPIAEIETLEKKMTAFVIPNAIQITTPRAKYSFASFLSRDTTFDVIFNIWRLVRPNDSASVNSSMRGSFDKADDSAVPGLKSKKTVCACSKQGQHYPEVALDTVVPGTPDRIHNLIFQSGFIKEFFAVNQKLLDIQIADWVPISPDSKLLARNMSYIKPLYASVGPKQTKCEIRDEVVHADFDDYVSTITTTRTPDVPSGGVFSVKTRTCIMWASAVSTRIIVTTQVEWTGRSFIKGIIERSAIDGQKTFQGDLEKAMRTYIQEHQSEFIPEGVDLAAIGPPPADTEAAAADETEDAGKKRERERNQRAFQWAYDTFDGARRVAVQSTKGALELVRDAWDQSSSNTILYFVIVILVISNVWTLVKMGSRTEHGRRIEQRKMEEREKWIQGVVSAVWDELASGKGPSDVLGDPSDNSSSTPALIINGTAPPTLTSQDLREEFATLWKTLDEAEARIQKLRQDVQQLNALD